MELRAEKLIIISTIINMDSVIESLFESWLMCYSFGKCQMHNASDMPFIQSYFHWGGHLDTHSTNERAF